MTEKPQSDLYVQCFSLFSPSLRRLTEVGHDTVVVEESVVEALSLSCNVWRLYTGPNICHYEMGPIMTQDFTVAKIAILTYICLK